MEKAAFDGMNRSLTVFSVFLENQNFCRGYIDGGIDLRCGRGKITVLGIGQFIEGD